MVAIARRKCVGDDEAPASISRTAARSSGSDLGMSATGKKKTVLRTFSQTTTFVCVSGGLCRPVRFLDFAFAGKATTRSRRVGASYQHARVDQSSPHPPQRREARPSYSTSQRRTRSSPTPAVAHAHHPPLVHRTSETLRRSVNFMSSHASMSLPAPTRVGAAARAARRVALVRYVFITHPVSPSTTRARSRPPRRSGPVRVPEPSVIKAATPTGLQVAGEKKDFCQISNRRFFSFPSANKRLNCTPHPLSRASSLAGRARLWLPPRGPCAPRTP